MNKPSHLFRFPPDPCCTWSSSSQIPHRAAIRPFRLSTRFRIKHLFDHLGWVLDFNLGKSVDGSVALIFFIRWGWWEGHLNLTMTPLSKKRKRWRIDDKRVLDWRANAQQRIGWSQGVDRERSAAKPLASPGADLDPTIYSFVSDPLSPTYIVVLI